MELDGARVLVFGTTGAQGAGLPAAVHAAGGVPVRASSQADQVRAWRQAGLAGTLADLGAPDTVAAAAKEADAAALHLPISLADRAGLLASVRALRDAGLPVTVNLGSPVPPDGAPDVMGARSLAAAVVATGAVALTPTAYLENHAAAWALGPIAAGELVYPRPAEDVIAWVAAADLARAAVAALAADLGGELLTLAGPEPLTFPELAAELGAGLGRPLRFRRIAPGEYGDLLRPVVGPEVAAGVAGAYGSMPEEANPLMAPDAGPVWDRLGLRPTPARRWAADTLAPLLT